MPKWCRKNIKARYPGAFFKDRHPDNVGVLIIDFMQYVKSVPEHIRNVDQYVRFLVAIVRKELVQNNGHHTVIVCVDRDSPPVKRIVTYGKRYSRADPFPTDGAPYLSRDSEDPLPDWARFSSNRLLLQRELFPRLYNELIKLDPGCNQRLLLHGFPGRTRAYRAVDAVWEDANERRERMWASVRMTPAVIPWSLDDLPITPGVELADPDLYNRVYLVEGVPPSGEFPHGVLRVEEIPAMRNAIKEADLGVLFYDHFYPLENQMISINDGDILPISILYARERVRQDGLGYRNEHYIRLPVQKPNSRSRFRYVDVNRLFSLVRDDSEFGENGVQNHEVTLATLIILAGTDFLKNHLKGVGKDTVMWNVFTHKLSMFSHMAQLSKALIPDTRTPRRIVLDEDLFMRYVNYCYTQKYGKSARRKLKQKQVSTSLLRAHCATDAKGQPRADTDLHFPERNKMRMWCRQVLWNLLYWQNGMKGAQFEPDPFEEYDGHPYYGYLPTGEMSMVVAARQKPVDEVYRRHFIRNREKRVSKRATALKVSPAKRQRIAEKVNGP